MSDIKRWDCVTAYPANSDPVGDMEERPAIGDYVLFADHERAVQEAVTAAVSATLKDVTDAIQQLASRPHPTSSDGDICPDCRGAAIGAAWVAVNSSQVTGVTELMPEIKENR